jgi:pimeloyl-ACP methyl ester carboxylesterase
MRSLQQALFRGLLTSEGVTSRPNRKTASVNDDIRQIREDPMKLLTASTGTQISYSVEGNGPPLVLIHGGFSDHETNWSFVAPLFQRDFTVYAIARRGRGATAATTGHTLEDEAQDIVDVIRGIGTPVYLVGHSYGAHCALLAAAALPDRVDKLVLYEPAWPTAMRPDALAALETLAAAGAWDQFAFAFFANTLHVPIDELEAVRTSELWPPIVADAPATLGDLRAFVAYRFDERRFAGLKIPVMLQIGSESPRDLYVTDALASVLSRARIETLAGQAHEGMTTAPEQYARATTRFLLGTADGTARSEAYEVSGLKS